MPHDFAERQKNDIIRDISSLGSLANYILFCVILLALQNYYLFKILVAGLIIIYLIVILIRTFYFKERPKKLSHHNYMERLDASAFPSLHAARIAFLGIVLANYYKNIFFSVLASLIVLGVLYSRIYLKKHDFSDVIVGVIVGIVVSYILYTI